MRQGEECMRRDRPRRDECKRSERTLLGAGDDHDRRVLLVDHCVRAHGKQTVDHANVSCLPRSTSQAGRAEEGRTERDKRLGPVDDAKEVDVDRPAPLVEVAPAKRPAVGGRDAGVEQEHVDLAERVERGVPGFAGQSLASARAVREGGGARRRDGPESLHLRDVRDVDLLDEDVVGAELGPKGRGRVLEGGDRDVGQGEPHAEPGERAGGGEADADGERRGEGEGRRSASERKWKGEMRWVSSPRAG